jgi:hypothetical protein
MNMLASAHLSSIQACIKLTEDVGVEGAEEVSPVRTSKPTKMQEWKVILSNNAVGNRSDEYTSEGQINKRLIYSNPPLLSRTTPQDSDSEN